MVRRWQHVFALLVTILVMKGDLEAAKADDGEHLVGKALETAFVGNTIEGTFPDGTYTVFFLDAHEMHGRFAGKDGSSNNDSGVWQATEDGLFCRKWRNWAGGARSCTRVFRKDSGLLKLVKPDGSTLIDDVKLMRGNVAGL
jgi:hypothetical protein